MGTPARYTGSYMAGQNPTRFNWPAAFCAYCHNVPIEEIAQVYGMELGSLQSHIMQEGWAKLRNSVPQIAESQALARPTEGEKKLALLQENRQKNLAIWVALRDDLLDVVGKLRDGTLKMEKHFHHQGNVTTEEVNPTMGDRVNLATYARTIADGTYRALGDYQATEKPGQDAIGGQAAAGVPSITIILPGVVAYPREQRAIDITADSSTEPVPNPTDPPEDSSSKSAS